ncbi:MAG: LCP family protein [Clostridia bacterium]|nr:LCP family protein [Clostridia bacterium]
MNKKRRIILFSAIAGCAVLLGIIAALIFSSLGTGDAFRNGGSCCANKSETGNNVSQNGEAEENPIVITTGDPSSSQDPSGATTPSEETETPEPTEVPVDPYEELMEEADTSMMKDIVNILLVGVDYSTERESWRGKDFHSDAMIVLAVNFDENRADLISLPRDTYASIPGVKGIYKLNASLNCGGGLYNKDGSFNPKGLEKVCEAAEWMLGGVDVIPVDYYYAVTMTSLKELVDLCGGLEYDMDIEFWMGDKGERHYYKGPQHIDGQGFLDYCRVRKAENGLTASQTTDRNRVDRQKKMLIALFRQMKMDHLITKIPQLIETFDGELFTNCTPAQTAALAAFAYNLDPANINMYSMSGSMASLFQWNFCFTDQSNRVKIVKDVYNVDVKTYRQYTLSYGRYHWCDMLYDHYSELLTPLTKYVQDLIDEDDKLPEFPPTPEPTEAPTEQPTAAPTPAPTKTAEPTEEPTAAPTAAPTAEPTEEPTAAPTAAPTAEPTPETTDSGEGGEAVETSAARRAIHYEKTEVETRKYTAEQREQFENYKTCIEELEELHKEADKEAKKYMQGKTNDLNSVGQKYLKKLEDVQKLAIELAKTFGYTKVKDFNVAFGPTACYRGRSAWAINYFDDRKFNEVKVDFN